MTRFRYLLLKALQSVGVKPSNKLQLQAAFEAHLLRDAEMTIGSETWENVSQVGGLEATYKRLKKDATQYTALTTEIEEVKERLAELQGAQHDSLNSLAVSTGSAALDEDQKERARGRLKKEQEKIIAELAAIEQNIQATESKLNEAEVNTTTSSPQERNRFESALEHDYARKEQLERRYETVVAESAKLGDDEAELKKTLASKDKGRLTEAEAKRDEIKTLMDRYSSLRGSITQLESNNLAQFLEVGKYLITYRKESEVKKVRNQHSSLFGTVDDIRKSYFRCQRLIGT